MLNIVARKFRDPLHNLEHSRDELLQDLCLFADDFTYGLVCQRQNALQPIQEDQWHLVTFVLFLQELSGLALSPLLIRQ